MESLVHAMLSNAVAAAVLAVLVAIVGRVWRRPALIHGLWLIVMLKLVTPPVVPVSLPAGLNFAPEAWSSTEFRQDHPESIAAAEPSQDLTKADAVEAHDGDLRCDESVETAEAHRSDGETGSGSEGWLSRSSRVWNMGIGLLDGWNWEQLVAVVVLLGAVGWWLLAFVRIIQFHRLMKEIDPAPEAWQTRTVELAERLRLSEAPCLCLVPGRVPPMLWAIGGRPRLLVPAELWSETSVDQRTSLLLHELAHLKRRDHWVRWLELIVGGLYWWHPAVWWGRRLLREAEEQCCDAWVVWAMPQGAKTYATALLAAIEFVSGARTAPAASSAASGNGHVSCLKRRLKMIVRAQTPKGLSWAGRLAVLGTAALLLPLAPSWGQKSDPDPGRVEPGFVVDFYEHNMGPVQLLTRVSQDDDRKDAKKEEGAKEEKSRETAERFEEHVRNLIDRLAKELGPVGEELRKILEKSVAEVHESLKKEGATPEDVRKALEKSHNEMRKAFEKGGAVNKELRESMEKSRRDMQEEWERARGELRSAMRERVQARRQQERGREAEKGDEPAKDAAPKEAAEIERERAEIEKARGEVRTLEQQLRQAQRRLVELQRRTMQRNGPGRRPDVPAARVAPGRGPDDAPSPRGASPRSPRAASPPADSASPRNALPPGARRPDGPSRRPQVDEPRGSGARPGGEERLRDLENKLERVLKELEKLKDEKKSQESEGSSSRRARPGRFGTPAIL
jgi:bla regulator protein BlaR1